MKIKDFIIPKDVSEACSILRKNTDDSMFVVAGGTFTSFISGLKDEKIAVDISKLPWRFIKKENGYYEIGALSTIDDLMTYSCCEKNMDCDWPIGKFASLLNTQPVRNMSTIGGNISKVFYWSDFPIAILALDGIIKLVNINDESEIEMSAVDFFKQQPANFLINGSYLVKSIKIKPTVNGKTYFEHYKESKTYRTFSMMSVAMFVSIDSDIIDKINIVLGACTNLPIRLHEIENKILGKDVSELKSNIKNLDFDDVIENIKLYPRDGMSVDYCKHLIKVKIIDILSDILNRVKN